MTAPPALFEVVSGLLDDLRFIVAAPRTLSATYGGRALSKQWLEVKLEAVSIYNEFALASCLMREPV